MSPQRNQAGRDHQLVAALFVITMAALAGIVVVVTRNTAGLRDLVPLLVGISSVVLTGRGDGRAR